MTLIIDSMCKCAWSIRLTFAVDDVKHRWKSETAINIGRTPHWPRYGIMTSISCHPSNVWERKTSNSWATVYGGSNYLQEAPSNAKRCAPRSLRTTITASMLVGDEISYLWYAPTHPESSAPRLPLQVIFLPQTWRHPRHGLMTDLKRYPFWRKREGASNVLANVGDDAKCLPESCSSSCSRTGLLQPGLDVIEDDLQYHTIECCDTEHVIELTLRPRTLPPHLESTTNNCRDVRVRHYIPMRWLQNFRRAEILVQRLWIIQFIWSSPNALYPWGRGLSCLLTCEGHVIVSKASSPTFKPTLAHESTPAYYSPY